MEKLDVTPPKDFNDPTEQDLAGRLARYRRRVEAEGRNRSLRVIDQAIRDANDGGEGSV